jgi:disulfide bond formation protein DsbB
MVPARSRLLFSLAFLATCLVLSVAFYLQNTVGLLPCSLYLLQGFAMAGFGLVCLAAALHGPAQRGLWCYAWAGLAVAMSGGLVAARHVWIQGASLVGEGLCGGDPGCPWQNEPLGHALEILWLGSAQCTQVNWSFLDLSWPEWSLLAFVGMALFSLLQLLQGRRARAAAQ